MIAKFNLWARYSFPKYFTSPDAEFHEQIDLYNLQAYRGELKSFVDIAFRGAAKTARTKLFIAFCVANDTEHYRRYIKVLAADGDNSKQIVTDVYNMLISAKVSTLYPEIFVKTGKKREERMASFTTTTGIKVVADTVGTDQRGAIQEETRPDLLWFEDFENRTTLRSGKKTQAIRENMEEARTGLSVNGSAIYTCNYISENGNVHMLVTQKSQAKKVLIIAITKDQRATGEPTWPERYPRAAIAQMQEDDDDFEGERLCKPSAAKDVFFNRETLERMEGMPLLEEIAGLRIYSHFNPSHRYGSGHDVAGGVGLDSSTSVILDFSMVPARDVAVFESNTIRPDDFGHEIDRETRLYNKNIAAIEKNNHGHATIAIAKRLKVNLFKTQSKETRVGMPREPTEYGWHTNALTKPKMLFDLASAIEKGLLVINDPRIREDLKGYTRNDLIENENDPRLTTRHFDLVIALAIAWQMRNFAQTAAEASKNDEEMAQLIKKNESLQKIPK